MKKILTIFALVTIFLSCMTLPSFADIENGRQGVIANNPDLVYLNCDANYNLWFVDKTSIENREDENGAKYWVARVYLFHFFELNKGQRYNVDTYGKIKDGQKVHNTVSPLRGSYLIAVNKKQPQVQYLQMSKCGYIGVRKCDSSTSWPFNVNRWEEFPENNLNADVYKYVKEHGGVLGSGTLGGKGVMIIIGAIIALGAILALKRKSNKYAAKIQDAGNIVQSTVNKSAATVTDSVAKKQADITTEHKFCRKCGTKVDINAKFCPKCGEKF